MPTLSKYSSTERIIAIQDKFFKFEVDYKASTELYTKVKNLANSITKKSIAHINNEMCAIVDSYIEITSQYLNTQKELDKIKKENFLDEIYANNVTSAIDINYNNLQKLNIKLNNIIPLIKNYITDPLVLTKKDELEQHGVINIIKYIETDNVSANEYIKQNIHRIIFFIAVSMMFFTGGIERLLKYIGILGDTKLKPVSDSTWFEEIMSGNPFPMQITEFISIFINLLTFALNIVLMLYLMLYAIRLACTIIYTANRNEIENVTNVDSRNPAFKFLQDKLRMISEFSDKMPSITFYFKKERIAVAKDIINQLLLIDKYKNTALVKELSYILKVSTSKVNKLSDVYCATAIEKIGYYINANHADNAKVDNLLNKRTFTMDTEAIKIGIAYTQYRNFINHKHNN